MKTYIVIVHENKMVMGGEPCINGTRLPIRMLNKGLTKFKKYYPLTKNTGDWWKKSLFEIK